MCVVIKGFTVYILYIYIYHYLIFSKRARVKDIQIQITTLPTLSLLWVMVSITKNALSFHFSHHYEWCAQWLCVSQCIVQLPAYDPVHINKQPLFCQCRTLSWQGLDVSHKRNIIIISFWQEVNKLWWVEPYGWHAKQLFLYNMY